MSGERLESFAGRVDLLFLSRFLRNPRTVGAVLPSSVTLAHAVLDGLNLARGGAVVELGPGTGVFTREILRRLAGRGRYVGVDIDPAFVERLRRRWPTLDCVCASAADLPAVLAARGLARVDHIVSSLPFASLPASTSRRIVAAVGEALRPGGTFTTFQYAHAYGWPAARAFRRRMSARLGGPPTARFVVRNVPPAVVLTWVHRAGPAA
jgi:phosphatidylethanolamine/phosphatidyl-N-methylethanolamine N-methyltransferase